MVIHRSFHFFSLSFPLTVIFSFPSSCPSQSLYFCVLPYPESPFGHSLLSLSVSMTLSFFVLFCFGVFFDSLCGSKCLYHRIFIYLLRTSRSVDDSLDLCLCGALCSMFPSVPCSSLVKVFWSFSICLLFPFFRVP